MPEKDGLDYQFALPQKPLTDFVRCFWQLSNHTREAKIVTVLPDGYFDILFFLTDNRVIGCSLIGLATQPMDYVVPRKATTFAISFKLLAAEYVLNTTISSVVNKSDYLPANFWNLNDQELPDFGHFVETITRNITKLANKVIDPRKQQLFDLLYASKGALSVEEISDTVHWSSRQINRYFTNRYGVSLKTYCTLLRYRGSFEQLKEGQLQPNLTYADQAHFIKEVKKYSGVTPKQLAGNKNDRFIQLSPLPKS